MVVREIRVKKKYVCWVLLILFFGQFSIIFTNVSADDEGPLVPPAGLSEYAGDILTFNATNIEAETAQLNGWYGWGGNDPATCGFEYHDSFPIESTNITLSGNYNNESVAKIVTNLNSSDIYYYFLWADNSTGWFRSYNNASFLTKPSGPPQNLTVSSTGANNITLTWDNVTDWQNHTGEDDFYQESIIRYSSTSQPNSPTDGVLAYRGVNETVTLEGLDLDTQYYFSAWTHVRDNVSMNSTQIMQYQNSSEFSTTTAYTQGGLYNITIRYENRTYGNVNLTRYGPHKMIIYYYGENLTDYFGETDYVIFSNNASDYEDLDQVQNTSKNETITLTYTPSHFVSVQGYNNSTGAWFSISDSYWAYNSTTGTVHISDLAFDANTSFVRVIYGTLETFTVEHDPMNYFDNNNTNFTQGKVTFSVNKTIKSISFHWNDSDVNINRCNRMIVMEEGQRDYDIFIRDDLPVYGEGQPLVKNHTLVKYMYTFSDETGLFRLENNPIAYIYIYDSEDNKLIVHSEYFDYELHVNPWLVYEQEYFIGVKCDELEYERIGRAPAFDNQQPEVRIPYEWDQNYSFYDLINITTGWSSTGFYVIYEDTTYSTVSATFQVYGMINGTLLYTSSTTSSYKNFTYTGNTTYNYEWKITTILDDLADEYDGTYSSTNIPVFGGMEPIIDNETIDEILGIILGPSPMYYDPDATGGSGDRPATEVPWTYIAIFGICFIWMTTLGRLNASIAGLGVGAILTMAGGMITGMGTLFQQYAWWEGPVLIVIGVFVIGISLLSALGGVEK